MAKSSKVGWVPVRRGSDGKPRLDEKVLFRPLRWRGKREAVLGGAVDLFDDQVTDEMREQVIAVMALSPKHRFAAATAHPDRAEAFLSDFERQGPYTISKTRAHAWRDPRDGTRLLLPENAAWPPANLRLTD